MRVGLWSEANGDVARQGHSGTIQYGEAFCVLAAAVEYGLICATHMSCL